MTQYDRQTGNVGLFAHYIDTFVKMKAEVIGYPSWVHSPADEDRYISDFADSEGIQLDKEAIASNPGKRDVTKLCLILCGLS